MELIHRDATISNPKLTQVCSLTLYLIIMPFDAFGIYVFENIVENGAFALLEQMLHFP